MAHPVIHWFRQDLRLSDQPALSCGARVCATDAAPYFRVFNPEATRIGAKFGQTRHFRSRSERS